MHFILINGPNGVGKSTFIAINRQALLHYVIIQPDDDRNWRLTISSALQNKKNILLESPWNSPSITEMLRQVQGTGYDTTLYQLYLNHPKQSWERVSERNKIINRQLDFDTVIYTFNENFRNVFQAYHVFGQAFFINALSEERNLILAFENGVLTYLAPNDDNFLITFREIAYAKSYLTTESYHLLL